MGVVFDNFKRTIKEEGLLALLKKICMDIGYKFYCLRTRSRFTYNRNYNKYYKEFTRILKEEKYEAVVVFDSRVGWNIPLFQRSQHMANELTDKGLLYFYRSSEQFDKDITEFKKLKDRLHIVNMANYALNNAMFDVLREHKGPKFLSLYSTDVYLDEPYIKEKYTDAGFHIIYEYIDEMSDQISGWLPEFVYARHQHILEDTENFAIGSADKLIDEIREVRGDKNVAMITNGVQYRDWIKHEIEVPEKIKNIVAKGNPIIGYFGALAKWFDYELLRELAVQRPNLEIVLIGFLYDEEFKKSKVEELPNVHYIGVIDYVDLPKYGKFFDVSTIPFLLNDITESTSPVKLFEYMAMAHPIVTTDMRECRKYKSVLIGKDTDDFIAKVDEALSIPRDSEYYEWLEEEALENTWTKKAEVLYDLVKKNIK
ncbi:MAG: glycosyltransferase [Sarcina sp.]